jgi:DNA-binding transcriptional regulator GbsR (MarR family)
MSESDLDAARGDVIEAMARSIEVYGFSRSYGRLYGILFFAEEPMSLDTLTEESDYAKSTVSTAMSDLKRMHLVHRRSMPGEGKKAYFEAETDFWYIAQELLNREVMREIRIMSRALDGAAETFEQAETDKAARDLEKIRKLQQIYDRSEQLVDLLTGQSIDRLVSLLKQVRSIDSN